MEMYQLCCLLISKFFPVSPFLQSHLWLSSSYTGVQTPPFWQGLFKQGVCKINQDIQWTLFYFIYFFLSFFLLLYVDSEFHFDLLELFFTIIFLFKFSFDIARAIYYHILFIQNISQFLICSVPRLVLH